MHLLQVILWNRAELRYDPVLYGSVTLRKKLMYVGNKCLCTCCMSALTCRRQVSKTRCILRLTPHPQSSLMAAAELTTSASSQKTPMTASARGLCMHYLQRKAHSAWNFVPGCTQTWSFSRLDVCKHRCAFMCFSSRSCLCVKSYWSALCFAIIFPTVLNMDLKLRLSLNLYFNSPMTTCPCLQGPDAGALHVIFEEIWHSSGGRPLCRRRLGSMCKVHL